MAFLIVRLYLNYIFPQDTAKSNFSPALGCTFIDLNRAGTGLMEIVSEADMRWGPLNFKCCCSDCKFQDQLKRLELTCGHCKLFYDRSVQATVTWNRWVYSIFSWVWMLILITGLPSMRCQRFSQQKRSTVGNQMWNKKSQQRQKSHDRH